MFVTGSALDPVNQRFLEDNRVPWLAKPFSLVDFQELIQRREQKQDVLTPAAETHRADAPDFALERAKAAGDFDIVILQQAVRSAPPISAAVGRRQSGGGAQAGQRRRSRASRPAYNISALAIWAKAFQTPPRLPSAALQGKCRLMGRWW
jgi:hypothetical protein